ncbi:MAG TPA: hypothetical protein VKA21_07135, partial [Candidatus Binatia bacterium]|nr:hypothetical protein [Candidatus Binatia bacterium]
MLTPHAASAVDPPTSTAVTLSGLRSNPRRVRSVRAHGAGIRFRAPVDGTLASVTLAWRRHGEGCALTLHEDAGGAPGVALASGLVPRGSGWRATALGAPLRAGSDYHVAVWCDGRRSRLAYLVDHDDEAVASGAWHLEGRRTRRDRHRASPLFALAFADGRSWGQPYRPVRRSFRICGDEEVSAALVPSRPLTVTGVGIVSARSSGDALEYTIEAADRSRLLDGLTVRE